MHSRATLDFIVSHANDDVRDLALQQKQYPDVDIAFALRQIEGRQICRKKLPAIYAIKEWYYPRHLSLEQCSSQETACYKKDILSRLLRESSGLCNDSLTIADLTGGFGADLFFLSDLFYRSLYIDADAELCRLAEHNFAACNKAVSVRHCRAEEYLDMAEPVDCIMLDPSRRDKGGNKVFYLDDCEPRVSELYTLLHEKCRFLLLKLSPMLDMHNALRQLPHACEVHIVTVSGEVKEMLVVCDFSKEPTEEPLIHAVNLQTADNELIFTNKEERTAECLYADSLCQYIYEPNAAIMKAGAFRLLSYRFNLKKLAVNSHLYTSEQLVADFPGRVFLLSEIVHPKSLHHSRYSIIARNYPLSADRIRAKYKIGQSTDTFLIATRLGNKPIIMEGRKL